MTTTVNDSKKILKEVRELVKNQKYQEAIEKSKPLLKDDPNNYMANLLVGAAYQNINKTEAAKYLRKAVEYSTGPPITPLQGLMSCAPIEEQPKIFEQLIDLVPEKCGEYYNKIYAIGTNPTTRVECFQILKREFNQTKDERKDLVLKYLGRLWVANDYKVEKPEEHVLRTALEQIITDPKVDEHLIAYKRYLKLLYNCKEYENCVQNASAFIAAYPQNVYGYEWICKIYCEEKLYKQIDITLEKPIEFYANKLENLQPHSILPLLVRAVDNFFTQKYIEARDFVTLVLELQPDFILAKELLALIQMKIGAYGLAVLLWQQLGKTNTLDYAICLSFETDFQKLNEAIELLFEQPQTPKVIHALARCYFQQKEKIRLAELPLSKFSLAEFVMPPAEALEYLKNCYDCEKYSTLILTAKFMIEMKNYTDALMTALKATKLRPYRAECFFILGKLYYETHDTLRSRKCFEKCVNLNPLCEEAVNNLSAIYQEMGEEDLNVVLLLSTLKHFKCDKSKHIHFKLGLHYLNVKKWDDAIQSFRTAIKFDIFCLTYWESLGDAYAARGSYYSAIRVFQKILEMDSKNIYAKLQFAKIRMTIRMYEEAIEDFNNLIRDHPNYLLGLKGAAEAHIGLAHNLKLDHRYGACKVHLQLAIDFIQRIFLMPENHTMVWLWRLTAYIFLQVAQMPKSMATLEVSGELAKRSTKTVILDRSDLLNLATRFYTCALKLKQNTYLLYELSLAFYYCGHYMPEKALSYLEMASKVCKKAIITKSDRWENWNLLGVINLHNEINNIKLANHCFVQAVFIERKSHIAWTNLGVLYLILKDIKLANQAFQRAQQCSPVYPNAWIGQALIAETIGEEEEALDLLRHCQQFEYHPESALGYAHWVCDILSTEDLVRKKRNKHAIENMNADVVALDAINWYVQNEEDNLSVAALTIQGFLRAGQKLYTSAVISYLTASQKAINVNEKDSCLASAGFIYLKAHQYEKAIGVFNMMVDASFHVLTGLALAYSHCGQHQEAYSLYNSVLRSVSEEDDNKSANILVAMASMVYGSQGDQDTKTILYQCMLLNNPPPAAIYAACALGILHNDKELASTMLVELKCLESSEEHIPHVAYIIAHFLLSNQLGNEAFTYLLSRLHIFPHNAELRKVVAKFMLDYMSDEREYVMPTTRIALSALQLAIRLKKKRYFIGDADTLLLAYRALYCVDKPLSLKILQRAIHIDPQNIWAWKMLLLTTQ